MNLLYSLAVQLALRMAFRLAFAGLEGAPHEPYRTNGSVRVHPPVVEHSRPFLGTREVQLSLEGQSCIRACDKRELLQEVFDLADELYAVVVGQVMDQDVAGTATVRRPDALVARVEGHPVAPQVGHLEALGVPHVCLQPHVAALAACVLGQQVARTPAVLATRPLPLGRVRLIG
uniref:Putative secreted protein n=1 Tax=Ixodes ricinus TaxID=34613 RepID=A0A6B0V0R3_IXORI